MKKKIGVGIRLPPNLMQRIREQASREDRTISAIIERACRRYLLREERRTCPAKNGKS